MKSSGCYKDFELPLNGGMDTRSPSGKVDFLDFRLVLNMDGSEQRGYCRIGGWQPYLMDSELGFKNQDLHDQMVGGQFYQQSYTFTIPSVNEITGFQYEFYYPAQDVPAYSVEGSMIGPFCGYFIEAPYLFESSVVNQWRVCHWSIGFPYNVSVASGAGGYSLTCDEWAIAIRSNGFSQAENAVEAIIGFESDLVGDGTVEVGPEEDDHIQTHWLTFCLPPDATNLTVIYILGTFQGFYETGNTCDCEVASGGGSAYGCNTGEPYFYSLSDYYLCYAYGYSGYTIPAHVGGNAVPVYTTTPGTSREYCYPDLYYLQNNCREAITALFSVNSVGGRRRLIAATRSRIYVNDDRNGNWRILADGLGGGCERDDDCSCSPKKFRIAALGNTVLFTNGIDPVISWEFDESPDGCFFWSADYVAQLRQLDIDTATVVQTWNGFAFIADVTENGDRFASRVYWSDYNDPLSWIPGGESLAGFHDFGNGEKVLAMEPIGGRLRIYTDKAIYDCILVRDPEQVFSFQEIYRGPNVLRYRFSMVNTGDSHVYLGESSIYVMAEYDRTPQRIEWVHRASGVIYSGTHGEWVQDFDGLDSFGSINKDACDQAVGGWDSARQAIWFSWPTDNNQCPNMSLVLWPRYQKSSLVDHGFTAFINHRPDFRMSIRDFFWTNGFCHALDLLLDKEGIPYEYGGGEYYPYLYNEYEDPDYPRHPESAISSLCGVCLHDICEVCDVDVRYLMASATDFTIKEFTPDTKIRVMLESQTVATFPDTSVATYTDVGYYSMMQGDLHDYRTPVEKLVSAVTVAHVAELQTTPNLLNFQLLYGAQPECTSIHDSDAVDLSCLGEDYDETTNERPGEIPRFAFHTQGVYLGWRFWVSGTGGGACFSQITFSIKRAQGCW